MRKKEPEDLVVALEIYDADLALHGPWALKLADSKGHRMFYNWNEHFTSIPDLMGDFMNQVLLQNYLT